MVQADLTLNPVSGSARSCEPYKSVGGSSTAIIAPSGSRQVSTRPYASS